MIPPPDALPWSTLTNFHHKPALDAFLRPNKCPGARMLSKANAHWLKTTHERFGSNYRTKSPQQWATQALALNISVNLARHVSRKRSGESDRNRTKFIQRTTLPPRPTTRQYCITRPYANATTYCTVHLLLLSCNWSCPVIGQSKVCTYNTYKKSYLSRMSHPVII